MTDFIAAVKSGNVNACSEILERDGSGVLNARDAQGFTALHHAALAGSAASVDWLVSNANADLHVRNAKGETALHLAVLRGVLPCVQALIRAGADTCKCDHAGYSILHHSVMARQIAISNELLEANPGLAKIQDNTGRSSLHWAAYGGLKDVVDRLVTAGADPNLTDNDGCTPLHLAASFGHNMVIKALIEKGASAKCVEMKEGKTAIDTAASKGHHSIARYLSYVTNRKLPLKKRTKFGIKSIPSLLGLFITLVVPPIISICSYFWLIPVSILGTIFAMSMKKHVSRTHQMEHFAYTLFFGTNALLTFTFLFGVATNELPIWTSIFALGAGVVWHLFFTLIGSDAGVVEQTESESNTITRAIETASFPEDHCVTCGVKRLPRMKHCAVCGKCVSKFDHHCVFLLGCVGEKNHKRFWLLLVLVLFCAVSFVRLSWHFLMKEEEIDETVWLNTNWIGFCFLWVSSNSFWIFSLCFLQTRLIANNLTFNEHVNAGRYEYLQDSRGLFLNPYDKGGFGNFLLFLGLPTKLFSFTSSASKRDDSGSFV